MDIFSNGAIAVAYFALPLTLIPLLRTSRKEVRLNLIVTFAFVFSCGLGHALVAFQQPHRVWHWLTAIISWIAVGVLLNSRNRLRYLGETFRLLEATWEQSINGKILWERVDNDLKLLKINPAAILITKGLIQPGDRLCEKLPIHRQPVYPYHEALIDLYLQALESQSPREMEFRYEGEISGWFLTVVTPISQNLLYMDFSEISGFVHDPLTNLYNRRILDVDGKTWHACLYIDLDRFKLINDQRGHLLGDELLVAIANALQSLASQNAGIAVRLGGDEFLLLLPDLDQDGLYTIATQVLRGILEIEIKGASVSASIGIASRIFPSLGADASEESSINQLLQAAETALREAKRNRRSDQPQHRIRHWDQELDQRRQRQMTLEAYLQRRNSEAEFWLAYQPICHMLTGKIVGAEALIRWNSADLGPVYPSEFIPLAETTGLIHRISDWVLPHALEQLAVWQEFAPDFSLSINISPLELEDDDFIERILQRVSETNIKREQLGLEITERGIYQNLERYIQSLQALKDMSLRLKVDDFGMGQSGLAQLLQFQFNEVKIDRFFIPTQPDDLEKIAICQAIAKLAEGIQFDLVAEGIEQTEQREMMLAMNYQYGQGYLFSQPLNSQSFTNLLQADTRLC